MRCLKQAVVQLALFTDMFVGRLPDTNTIHALPVQKVALEDWSSYMITRIAEFSRCEAPFWVWEVLVYYQSILLLCLQIPNSSASFISCSLKSGCAREIIASARSHVESPFMFLHPYSVTT